MRPGDSSSQPTTGERSNAAITGLALTCPLCADEQEPDAQHRQRSGPVLVRRGLPRGAQARPLWRRSPRTQSYRHSCGSNRRGPRAAPATDRSRAGCRWRHLGQQPPPARRRGLVGRRTASERRAQVPPQQSAAPDQAVGITSVCPAPGHDVNRQPAISGSGGEIGDIVALVEAVEAAKGRAGAAPTSRGSQRSPMDFDILDPLRRGDHRLGFAACWAMARDALDDPRTATQCLNRPTPGGTLPCGKGVSVVAKQEG